MKKTVKTAGLCAGAILFLAAAALWIRKMAYMPPAASGNSERGVNSAENSESSSGKSADGLEITTQDGSRWTIRDPFGVLGSIDWENGEYEFELTNPDHEEEQEAAASSPRYTR